MFALRLDALYFHYFYCIDCIVVLHVKEKMKINFLTLRNVNETFRMWRNDPSLGKRNVRPEPWDHFSTLRSVNNYRESRNEAFQGKRNVTPPARGRTNPPLKKENFRGT